MAGCSSEQAELWGLPSRRQKGRAVTLTSGREACRVGRKGRSWVGGSLAEAGQAARMLGRLWDVDIDGQSVELRHMGHLPPVD